MNCSDEFATVDLVINSDAETRGIDAFALSVVKSERQLRKIFTHLVFQFPCFSKDDVPALRKALCDNTRVYFDGFEKGFNVLYYRSIEELVGSAYKALHARLDDAIDIRNKIFHGQLTNRNLDRKELFGYVSDVRTWCQQLADACVVEFAYDGFGRNSFQKGETPVKPGHFKIQLCSVDEYRNFIGQHMERQVIARKK